MEQVKRSLHHRTDSELENFPVLVCPSCHGGLERAAVDLLRCATDGLSFERIGNIWRFLPPDRTSKYFRFILEYETIRKAEGRALNDSAFYRELPFKDITGKFNKHWKIRRKTYLKFISAVIQPLSDSLNRSLKILDLGAGNGWLSNQLSQLGHRMVALDLLTNNFDGLGACDHYSHPFFLVQSEFDRQPFADESFDLAVFNASFHYSENYATTLEEILRVIDKKGRLVVLDSPIYRSPQSGMRMVEERETHFAKEYGFPSNALRSENYLTFQKLDELARRLSLRWKLIRPYYGLKWHLKPLRAKLKKQREPAKFFILVGERRNA